MAIYINIETGEYPRHLGDVELNPNLPWQEVILTDAPVNVENGKAWVEDVPILEDGQYRQSWKQVDVVNNTDNNLGYLTARNGDKFQKNAESQMWEIVE
jgi:hypothetical protein